jgi:hypothetical protein
MPLRPLGKQTLKLAVEGQIFDEGKGLLSNTLKKCFPPPETGVARGASAGAPARQVFD